MGKLDFERLSNCFKELILERDKIKARNSNKLPITPRLKLLSLSFGFPIDSFLDDDTFTDEVNRRLDSIRLLSKEATATNTGERAANSSPDAPSTEPTSSDLGFKPSHSASGGESRRVDSPVKDDIHNSRAKEGVDDYVPTTIEPQKEGASVVFPFRIGGDNDTNFV